MARVQLFWDPSNPVDPGPCIDVTIMNSRDLIEEQGALGLEYPKPRPIKALLDTGASVTVISQTFAAYCRLFQISEDI